MTMKKIQLGKTNQMISQLGLGCINFGTSTSESIAHQLIDTYFQLGGNLLDTANNYAFWNGGDGRSSERTIGSWLAKNSSIRNDIVLSTKLGALPVDLQAGFNNMQGASRQTIFNEVERSLDTLHTNYIDLLYLHVDDFHTSQTETLGALAEVITKGYVKHIGCSNFRTWRIERARQICTEYNFPFFSAVQQRYSYLQPVMDANFGVQVHADQELRTYLDYYKDLTFVSHTSLLYGAYTKDKIDDINYNTKHNQERLEEIKQLDNKIPWILHTITKEFGGSVALFTSGNVNHLKTNMNYFNQMQ